MTNQDLLNELRALSQQWREEARINGTTARHADELDRLLAAVPPPPPSGWQPIENGNVFVFCGVTDGRMGCVRGAGHNGPHAMVLETYPQSPVLLRFAPAPPSDQEP